MSIEDYPKVIINVEETLLDDCPVCKIVKNYKKDPRLHRWQKFLNDRKKIHKLLEKNVHRKPEELLMNAFEDYKTVKEEQMVLEYTKLPEADPLRGCPDFWKLPPALKEPCYSPRYFSVMPKSEGCKIPEIEYVKVPNYIKYEKEADTVRNIHSRWTNSEYKQATLDKLSYEVKRVEPSKPILDEMIVLGKSPEDKEVLLEKPAIESDSEQFEVTQEMHVVKPLFCINDFNIYDNDCGRKEIRLSCDYDFIAERIFTNYLNFKNNGKVAIRVNWKRCKHYNLFSDIIKDRFEETRFIFNKQMVVIIPGETFKYPIHFKPTTTGRFMEEWKLILSPNILPQLDIIIQLVGMSFIPDYHDKCKEIDKKLDVKMRKSIIENAINEVVDRAIEYQRPTFYTYDRAKLFEATNSHFDPVQTTSQYVYDNNLVNRLIKFYDKVRLPHHPDLWNLNIEFLKYVTEEREVYEKCKKIKETIIEATVKDEPLTEMEESVVLDVPTTCHQLKKDGKGKGKEKKGKNDKKDRKGKKDGKDKKDKKNKIEIIEQESPLKEDDVIPHYVYKYRNELQSMLKSINKTLSVPYEDQRKYAYAHSVFVAGMDKLCNTLIDLQNHFKISPPSSYPKIETSPFVLNSERQRFLHFDAVFKPKPVFLISMNLRNRPPPDILKEIPIEDTDRRYRAYFNIPEDTDNSKSKKDKGKGKKGKKDEKGKKEESKKKKKEAKEDKSNGKKGKKKDKIDKSEGNKQDDIDLDFDPYKEIDFPKELTVEDVPIEVTKPDLPLFRKIPSDYRYNLYVLFYTFLEDIFMNILEFFEETDTKPLPPAQINKVETSYSLTVENISNSYTKHINLDLITMYLEKNEDLTDIKEKLIATVRQYVRPEVRIDKPVLNPYVKSGAKPGSLWKCLRGYERPKERIAQKKTFTIKRKSTRYEDQTTVFTDTRPYVEEPLIREVGAQTDVSEEEINEPEEVLNIFEDYWRLSEDNLKDFKCCVSSKCLKSLLNEVDEEIPEIDVKTELIEKVFTEVKNKMEMDGDNNKLFNKDILLEICDVLVEQELLKKEELEMDEEEVDEEVFYDSDIDV